MSASQKRSHFDICDLYLNIHDAEIPVCKSQKVLGIIINEVLGWTEQIKDVAKRLKYSRFVLKKIKNFLLLKARITLSILNDAFRIDGEIGKYVKIKRGVR